MSDVTQILAEIHEGKTAAAGESLPLVYEERRNRAESRLAQEKAWADASDQGVGAWARFFVWLSSTSS